MGSKQSSSRKSSARELSTNGQFEPGTIITTSAEKGRGYVHFAVVISRSDAIGRYPDRIAWEENWQESATLSRLPRNKEHGSEIVARALRSLNEKGYHTAYNNCEHFTDWCYNGGDPSDASSRQAESTVKGVGGASGVVLAGGGGALVSATATTAAVVPAPGIFGWFGFTHTVAVHHSLLYILSVTSLSGLAGILGGVAISARGYKVMKGGYYREMATQKDTAATKIAAKFRAYKVYKAYRRRTTQPSISDH